MGGGSGGGGKSGRGGGGRGGGGDFSEAKLQARVDNMNNLVGKLNAQIKQSEKTLSQMNEAYSKNFKDYSKRAQVIQLGKNIRAEEKRKARDTKRMLNIYDRMNKIIDENS